MTLEEARDFFKSDRFATVTTGIEIDEVGENYSKCHLDIKDGHLAAGDHVMGGAIYTLADFSFAVASNTPEHLTMTLSSTITYLSQPKGKVLYSECECIKDGRRTGLFETKITDCEGRIIALVTSNGMHLS